MSAIRHPVAVAVAGPSRWAVNTPYRGVAALPTSQQRRQRHCSTGTLWTKPDFRNHIRHSGPSSIANRYGHRHHLSTQAVSGAATSTLSSPTTNDVSTITPDGLSDAAPALEPSILDPLAQALLSIPLPSGLTIILLTLILRSCITLPATLWQRGRLIRNAMEVIPRMRVINERLAGVVARESRKKGLGYEEYRKELKRQLAAEQSALHKRFNTHPTITLLTPLAVHIPVLIATSMTLRRALELPGSTMASEGFLWLDQLGEVDGTGALPLLGALLAMGNAELLGRKGRAATATAVGGDAAVAEADGKSGQGEQNLVAGARPPGMANAGQGQAGPSRQTQTRRFSSTTIIKAEPPKSKLRRRIQPQPQPLPQTPASQPKPPVSPSASMTPRQTSPTSKPPTRGGGGGGGSSTTPQAHLTSLDPKADALISEERKSQLRTRVITNSMRLGAILFIPIASTVPSALALYWVSSMAFTLGQSFYLNSLDARRRSLMKAKVLTAP